MEENKLDKKIKEMELSAKTLGSAMFMATVCLYMGIGALYASASGGDFYYHVSFAFLIQGVAVSLLASAAWVLCFGLIKSWKFFFRYLLNLAILIVIFGISKIIPVISSQNGHFLWIISGFVSTFLFITGVSILCEKNVKKTGIRSVLIWELK